MAKKARKKSGGKPKKAKRATTKAKKRVAAKAKKAAKKSKKPVAAKKKTKRKTAAKKMTAKKAAPKKAARKKVKAATPKPVPPAPPKTTTEKLSDAFHAVVDTVRETNELRDRLEPRGVSENT